MVSHQDYTVCVKIPDIVNNWVHFFVYLVFNIKIVCNKCIYINVCGLRKLTRSVLILGKLVI